jgi:hypothetical protein
MIQRVLYINTFDLQSLIYLYVGAFWNMKPYILLNVYRLFIADLHHQCM